MAEKNQQRISFNEPWKTTNANNAKNANNVNNDTFSLLHIALR